MIPVGKSAFPAGCCGNRHQRAWNRCVPCSSSTMGNPMLTEDAVRRESRGIMHRYIHYVASERAHCTESRYLWERARGFAHSRV